MHEILAKSDRQLGMCLRMLYDEGMPGPLDVHSEINDKGRWSFMCSFPWMTKRLNGCRSGLKPWCDNLILISKTLSRGWHRPALSLFAKVSLAFSCKLPKATRFQNFLLTRLDFCGNLSQQLNITYFYIFVQAAGLNILAFSPLHNRLA